MPEHHPCFVALDVHKHYILVAALDAQHQVVLTPRQVPIDHFLTWAQRHLYPTDQVVLEATSNAWTIHDLVHPLVAGVVVADPAHVKLIAASCVKTDKRDTLTLARLLAANLIPAVWVPPLPVRELRSFVAHRQRLVRHRTAAKNRLHSLVQRHNLMPPAGDLWSKKQQAWWDAQAIAPSERLRARQDLASIVHLSEQIREVEAELARLSVATPWADQVPFLIQLPGIALVTAMTILSAIGEITRFPSAKQLVGYSRLGAQVHASGKTRWSGSITKQGRCELRAVLVEAAWAATQTSAHWREWVDRLATRIGRPKAIVALARKLLVIIWHVLSRQVADRHAEAGAVARRLLRWGTHYGLATYQGVSRARFVRLKLDQVGVGPELRELTYNGSVFKLQPG